MLTTNPFDDDKLREECGIFGICGADNAASFVALGLHALQHRGQEAAGITSFDGSAFPLASSDGPCRGQFRPRRDHPRGCRAAPRSAMSVIRPPARPALRNVQPISPSLPTAASRVAHNGNLSNAMQLRRTLDRRGSIFQSTSDTEVIIHLVATSHRDQHARPARSMHCSQVEGAYSLHRA